jgi:hypothetical protein
MGCSSSTLSQTVADESVMLRRKPPRGSMLMSGYRTELISDLQNGNEAQRLVASNGSVSLSLPSAGYALRYAYISQRGYYPDAPDKANQDAACAAECVGGNAGETGRAWPPWQPAACAAWLHAPCQAACLCAVQRCTCLACLMGMASWGQSVRSSRRTGCENRAVCCPAVCVCELPWACAGRWRCLLNAAVDCP